MGEINATVEWMKALSKTVDNMRAELNKDHKACQVTMSEKVAGVQKELTAVSDKADANSEAIKTHSKYHRENEHKFGIPRYVKNNVFKCLIVALILGVILAGIFGVTWDKLIRVYDNVSKIRAGLSIEEVQKPVAGDTL